MEPVIVIILAEMVRDHQHLQIGGQVCLQRSAKGIGVAVVDRVTRNEVLAETVAAFVFSCHAECQRVTRDRSTDCPFERHRVVIAVGRPRIAFEVGGRTRGDDVDDAAGRSAAVGGALRAAQDFDLRNIVETAELRRRAAVDRTILQEGDRAVGSEIDAGQPDPADESPVDPELIAHRDIGHGSRQIARILDAAGTDIVCTKNGDRGCRILKRLTRLGRGDDDHVLAGAGRRSSGDAARLLRRRVPGDDKGRNRSGSKKAPRKADLCHVLSLHTDGIYNLPISILMYGQVFLDIAFMS